MSGSASDTICPGYNAEVALSLAFSIDSIDSRPTSEKILVANHFQWLMYLEKKEIENDVILLPHVSAEGMFKYPMTFDSEFTLEAKNPSARITSPIERFVYDEPAYDRAGWKLISYDKLLNDREKFEIDGQVVVTAKLKISMPRCCNFNMANSFFDVTINIGEVSFPFNKAVLVTYSPYFNDAFGNGTLTLDDIEPVEFVNFINVLFIRTFELKTNSVISVLELAVLFGIIPIVDHCKSLLINCPLNLGPCLTERLVLATDYSLKDLQNSCLGKCNSLDIIEGVMKSPFYWDLSSDVKVMLLDRQREILSMNISGRKDVIGNNIPLPTAALQLRRSRRRQIRNHIDQPAEIRETNENQPVGNLCRSVAETICPGYHAATTLSLTFPIDSINSKPSSEKILVANHLKWYVEVVQVKKGVENYLAAFVASEDMNKYPIHYRALYTLEANNAGDRVTLRSDWQFYYMPDYRMGQYLISCDKLLSDREKFETDDKVTVTVRIVVRMFPCYNYNAVRAFSDVTIKIGNVLLPFSKSALAMHSPFFHGVFFGLFKESSEDVVTLEDVDLATFLELMNVLFVRSFELDPKMDSVVSVLELSDRFGMRSIVDHCEHVLMECHASQAPNVAELLVLAAKYSLSKLQRQCLMLCRSSQAIFEVAKSPFFEGLSDEVKAQLLKQWWK